MQGKVIKNIVKIIATAMLVCVLFACLTGCLYDDPTWYTTEQHIKRISKLVQRHYMKDGDVYAIYTEATMGDTVVSSTEVIKKMTGDIPENTFELPDLSKYEKTEL